MKQLTLLVFAATAAFASTLTIGSSASAGPPPEIRAETQDSVVILRFDAPTPRPMLELPPLAPLASALAPTTPLERPELCSRGPAPARAVWAAKLRAYDRR